MIVQSLLLGLILAKVTLQQPPPPLPPPNQLFQITCDEAIVYGPLNNPGVQALLQEFDNHAPPGFRATLAVPQIYTEVNAHRLTVHYESQNVRQCEDLRYVSQCMNMYKPQNAVVAQVCVIPGGFAVTYYKYCSCQRRARQRRWTYYMDDLSGYMPSDYTYKKDTVQKWRGEGIHSGDYSHNEIEKPSPFSFGNKDQRCPLQCSSAHY